MGVVFLFGLVWFCSRAVCEQLGEEDTLYKHGTQQGVWNAAHSGPPPRGGGGGGWRVGGVWVTEQRAGRRQLLFSACVSKSSQLRRGTGVGWSFYLALSSLLLLSSPCVKQLVGFISGGQGI